MPCAVPFFLLQFGRIFPFSGFVLLLIFVMVYFISFIAFGVLLRYCIWAHRHTHTHTERERHTHTERDTHTDGDTYTHTQRERDTHTQRETHTRTDTHRFDHTHTHRQLTCIHRYTHSCRFEPPHSTHSPHSPSSSCPAVPSSPQPGSASSLAVSCGSSRLSPSSSSSHSMMQPLCELTRGWCVCVVCVYKSVYVHSYIFGVIAYTRSIGMYMLFHLKLILATHYFLPLLVILFHLCIQRLLWALSVTLVSVFVDLHKLGLFFPGAWVHTPLLFIPTTPTHSQDW